MLVQTRQRKAIDQQGRRLVAHAGAGRQAYANPTICARAIWHDIKQFAQFAHQLLIAQHTVADIVAEQNVIITARRQRQKGVKIHCGQELRGCHINGPHQGLHSGARHKRERLLNCDQVL